MAITTAMVKELRDATGAGVLDAKKALEATDGDFEKAVEHLREKGLAKAAKKASREAKEGQVAILLSDDGRQATMLEVDCETDFVARNESFQKLVQDLAEQAHTSDVSSAEELLASAYQQDGSKTVSEVVQEAISTIGENIVVRRLAKHQLEGSGLIESYIHFGGRVGVLVELSATEAGSDALKEFAHDLALQVAATNPPYLDAASVPEEVLENERRVLMAQLADDNKPDEIKARIVEGRLKKFYEENCLLNQAFVKDDKVTIEKLLQQQSKTLGSPVTVNRFSRFEIGSA